MDIKKHEGKRESPREALLYREVPHNGGLVFAPKELALYVARLHRALKRARTWGEFRAMVPPDEYSRVLRASFDNMGERRPRSSDSFSAEQVAGWSDGDYPQWLQAAMDYHLPLSILRQFGTRKHTFVNGSFWMIPPDNCERMIAALKTLGFEVESGRTIEFW